jgi:PleD family two-component response regulator
LTTAERFRAAIQNMPVCDSNGRPILVTASFGVANCEPGDGPDSIIDRADRFMYAAKSAGRNCVMPALSSVDDESREPREKKPAASSETAAALAE